MTIGQKIKAARKARKITQLQLGEGCGWTEGPQARISHYENGTRSPGLSELELIAGVLDMNVSDLIDYDEETVLEDPGIRKTKNEALAIMDRLTPEGKKKLIDHALLIERAEKSAG